MGLNLIGVLFCLVLFSANIFGSDLLTNPRYDSLKSEFLNIDPSYFSEIDISGMSSLAISDFIEGKTAGSPFALNEVVAINRLERSRYGAPYACTNAFGDQAVCWYATGGSKGEFTNGDCGSPINGDYAFALANPGLNCVGEAQFSTLRFWLGTNTSTEFIVDQFPGTSNLSINRLCVEVGFPDAAQLTFSDVRFSTSPNLRQIVNADAVASHLKDLRFEWGTYTAPRLNASGTTSDEEVGGTYQNGGSHFYHKPSAFDRPPPDRIYAINDTTLAICMGSIPASVRGGMRPVYIANPLLTLGGRDSTGKTTAPNYLNNVTRIYFDILSDTTDRALANYPFNISINKMWVMYEKNEIFLTDSVGSTLGLEMVLENESASYPVVLYNSSDEDRTYRIFMAMGQNQHLIADNPRFQLYTDINRNGLIDSEDVPLLRKPSSTIVIEANKPHHFVLTHSPDFPNSLERHGKKFSQGTLSFIEEGRLRSASYAVRTWQAATIAEITDKQEWFAATVYPSETTEWFTHKEFNQEYNIESNPNLIRNTLDYRGTYLGTRPKSPSLLNID